MTEEKLPLEQKFILAPAAVVYHNESVFKGYFVDFSPLVTGIEQARHWWHGLDKMRWDTITDIHWPLVIENGVYQFYLRQSSYPNRDRYGNIIKESV